MFSAFKPNIANLSNLPGFNPSRSSTFTSHVAPSDPVLPWSATHASTSSCLLRSACLAYLLESFIRKTLSSVSFPPSSTPFASPLRIRVGGKALVGQQRHCCEAHVAERRVILSASHPEVRADSGIAEEREKDDVGRLGSLVRMSSRMSLQREMSLELRASTFQERCDGNA